MEDESEFHEQNDGRESGAADRDKQEGSEDSGDESSREPEAEPHQVNDDEESGSEQNEEPDDESTLWAMFAHLSAFAGLIVPLGNLFGPLIIWLVKKKEDEYVDYHGKEALNFQIAMTIYIFVAALAILVFIGMVLVLVLALADIILTIIAAIKARDGKRYEYPYIFRLIE